MSVPLRATELFRQKLVKTSSRAGAGERVGGGQFLEFAFQPDMIGDVDVDDDPADDLPFFIADRQGGIMYDLAAAVETLNLKFYVDGGLAARDGARRRPLNGLDTLAVEPPPAHVFAELLDADVFRPCPNRPSSVVAVHDIAGPIQYPHPHRQYFQHLFQQMRGTQQARAHQCHHLPYWANLTISRPKERCQGWK